MAVVILGGLATSTVLNLMLLPALYERFGRTGCAHRGDQSRGRVTSLNGTIAP
jgi:hypothetical protein